MKFIKRHHKLFNSLSTNKNIEAINQNINQNLSNVENTLLEIILKMLKFVNYLVTLTEIN